MNTQRGWGYKIDYAKAIREDEARIAHLESPMCVRAARELLLEASLAYPTWTSWDVYGLITYKLSSIAERAAIFGLTLEDVRAWAFVANEERGIIWSVLGDEQKGDYARGQAIDDRLGCHAFDVLSEKDRRAALSKARGALARHKRNAEKFRWAP